MDLQVELEMCGNCRKEIPQSNYVMHTAHCARNISLCSACKEPVIKTTFEEHKKTCGKKKTAPLPPQRQQVAGNEQSKYFLGSHTTLVQDRQSTTLEKLADSGSAGRATGNALQSANNNPTAACVASPQVRFNSSLLPCQYCELELPKLDLAEHENYCGARTEKCQDCGELVLFKYRQLHQDTNHGFLKLNDEPGPRPSWDSPRRTTVIDSPTRYRPTPFTMVDVYTPSHVFNSNYSGGPLPTLSTTDSNGEKLESSKDISRRLDCKTEYIRNLLHDSASITAPIRSTGAVPRYAKHNKGPAPQPPAYRRNPPTELLIPCEFCSTPVPHEELIKHETGCRPELVRFNSRKRADSPDYFIAPEPSSPDVELPCEFCADLIPASRLLSHQATCN